MRVPKAFALPVLVFALTVAVFSSAITADFVQWDDDINIYRNPHIRGLSAESWKWAWTDTSYMRRYVPIAWLSCIVQFQLFGIHPWSWHFFNLVLLGLNTSLV